MDTCFVVSLSRTVLLCTCTITRHYNWVDITQMERNAPYVVNGYSTTSGMCPRDWLNSGGPTRRQGREKWPKWLTFWGLANLIASLLHLSLSESYCLCMYTISGVIIILCVHLYYYALYLGRGMLILVLFGLGLEREKKRDGFGVLIYCLMM